MTTGKTENAAISGASAPRANSLVTVPVEPPPPPRRRTFRLALASAIAVTALGAAWWGLSGLGAPPQVAVETLVSGPLERVLAVSGRTETDVHAEIRPLVQGRVTEVLAAEGDRVAQGDDLVRLDGSQQISRIRQALAALDAGILRQQQAEADRDRALRLGQTVSSVTLAEAERALALATAEVDRLEAALEQARLALQDHVIDAPISGVVLERSVEPGEPVGPADLLMRIGDPGDLHVEVMIDEIYAGDIQVDQKAWVQLAGHTGTETGQVTHVDAEVDDLTGSLRIKIDLVTPLEAQIGLTTIVNILIDTTDDAVTVPRRAFIGTGTGAAVLVLRDGRAQLTPITYVDWPAERVEVTAGPVPGDRILLDPEGIADGQRVTARDDTAGRD